MSDLFIIYFLIMILMIGTLVRETRHAWRCWAKWQTGKRGQAVGAVLAYLGLAIMGAYFWVIHGVYEVEKAGISWPVILGIGLGFMGVCVDLYFRGQYPERGQAE